MKKLFSRITKIFFAGLLSFVPLLSGNIKTFAAEENQKVVLHKRMFDAEPGSLHQNDGHLINDENHHLLQQSVGINGVEFKAIDVTDYYYEKLFAEDMDHEELDRFVEQIDRNLFTSDESSIEVEEAYPSVKVIDTKTTATTTDTNLIGKGEDGKGILTFDLPKVSNGKDAVYLLLETKAPAQSYEEKYSAMTVRFPVIDENEQEFANEYLHLYPKNIHIIEIPEINKELTEDRNDFSYGEEISYKFDVTIPRNLSAYTLFEITDSYAKGLALVENSLTAYFEETELNKEEFENLFDVTYSSNENKFKVAVNIESMSAVRENYSGNIFTFHYNLQILEGTEPDIDLFNKVELETIYNDEPTTIEDESKDVKTGGKRFVKVNALNDEQTLADAEFVVKNLQYEYLALIDGKVNWVEDIEDATIYTSDENGEFSVTGVEHGRYFLEETKAPNGYQLLEEDVAFAIDNDTYQSTLGLTAPQEVGNIRIPGKLPDTGGNIPEGGKLPSTGGSIPQTGEKSQSNLMLVGILLIVLATTTYVWKKRQN